MIGDAATTAVTDLAHKALSSAKPAVYWTDRTDQPVPTDPLVGGVSADLVFVGGGFTGLWGALQALEEQPDRRVAVVESQTCGHGASSRNGGFASYSLTHGIGQSFSLWPRETRRLTDLGLKNLKAIESTLAAQKIDAQFELVDVFNAANAQWQVDELEESAQQHRDVGLRATMLDGPGARAVLNSPTFVGGFLGHDQLALVDPAELVWGLRAAVLARGGFIFERSPVGDIESRSDGLTVRTDTGSIKTDRAVVSTNAFLKPAKRVKHFVLPVYDHVLMTEPLSAAQLDEIGWAGREGAGDTANQFHYYRLSADNRILWGGYDATYHFNNGVGARYEQNDRVHQRIAGNFFQTFPQLEDVTFTHRWGGPIGTTSRFSAAWGKAHGGRSVWVAGYTGLGVAASRFGARVALDLVDGVTSELTELEMVRKKPVPIPPEPIRSAVVGVTRRAMQKSDANAGARGPWLRLLDRFGVGFDS